MISFWILLFALPVIIQPGQSEVELNINKLEVYEDKTRSLTFEQILADSREIRFTKNLNFRPQDYNTNSAYWVRLTIDLNKADRSYLIEFFDQTIDSLHVYLKHDRQQDFTTYQMGDFHDFSDKPFRHKNFQIPLVDKGVYTCYFRVSSHEYADIRVAIRSYDQFVFYALSEYFLYGIFYGMIVIISLYNILIFSAIGEVKYLYYTFYILSVGLFAMSVDGVGYQYIWPGSPYWNQISHGIWLFSLIFWSILFSKKFLNLRSRSPKINQALTVVLVLRVIWFLYCLFIDSDLFQYRNIELIPLTLIFMGSITVFQRGYKPARFFIVAFGVLFLGFILKALLMLSVIPFYTLTYYSLHISFVFEMLFLSFALSDRVRILKANRDRAHKRIIQQHEESARMKDQMNAQLESLVEERTLELKNKNELLSQQKQEISEINSILDLDNWRLRNNIKSIQMERLQNKELSYEEFRELFSNAEECYHALSLLKWADGFACKRCGNTNYGAGTVAFSRRCSKCGYQESITTHTLFHGLKFPIEKALYILYDTLNENQYSLTSLGQILGLRKNTIGDFKRRIRLQTPSEQEKLKKIFINMQERKKIA